MDRVIRRRSRALTPTISVLATPTAGLDGVGAFRRRLRVFRHSRRLQRVTTAGDLGHLEDDIAPVADDLRADLPMDWFQFLGWFQIPVAIAGDCL